MTLIEELANELGISQRNMAQLIGANHTHLSRYASHSRSMPLTAQPQLTILVATIHKAPPPAPPQPSTAEKEAAHKKVLWNRQIRLPLYERLEVLQKAYQQATLLLYVLDTYVANNPQLSPKMQSWVAGQRYKVKRKIEASGWQAQQEVQWKIKVLEEEALFWEKAIAV